MALHPPHASKHLRHGVARVFSALLLAGARGVPRTPAMLPTASHEMPAGGMASIVRSWTHSQEAARDLSTFQVESQHSLDEPASRAARPLSFVSEALKKVGPAVIMIETETIAHANDMESPVTVTGTGSGFIITSSGLAVTNAHVIENAQKITVSLPDGRKFDAQVRGVDPLVDLAVLKLKTTEPLPTAKLGDSSSLALGDWVIAVGSPMGLQYTATLGIVSCTSRSSFDVAGAGSAPRVRFIQTDASINPGSSGGPLLNAYGEVVGINSCSHRFARNIGFAIPINKASALLPSLILGKDPEHAYIGVRLMTITPEVAKRMNDDPNVPIPTPEIHGVMIVHIEPDSPAALVGLRPLDVLQEVNGLAVKSAEDTVEVLEDSGVGKAITVKILRDGKPLEVSVVPRDLLQKIKQEAKAREQQERIAMDRDKDRSSNRAHPQERPHSHLPIPKDFEGMFPYPR